LLEEWNQFSNDEIFKWLEDKSMGFNEYDEENLCMSGTLTECNETRTMADPQVDTQWAH